MKRRTILLGATAGLALPAIVGGRANAQSASALGSTLTPFGADPKASASGLVPAWTGGVTSPPAGRQPGGPLSDLYPNDQPIFAVTADNAATYDHLLCDGQREMLRQFGAAGWKMNVYPSRRSFAAPQRIYDNAVLNVSRAQPSSGGLIWGFTNAVGAPPFPIPSSDPKIAGMQVMWNHATRYQGSYQTFTSSQWICSQGTNVVALTEQVQNEYPYYFPDTTPATYDNAILRGSLNYVQPPNQAGGKFSLVTSTDVIKLKNAAYQYLVGQGRIREAPAVQYDIPATQANDACNFDEIYLFTGSLDCYDWALLGKTEMIVPYNISALFHAQPDATAMTNQFIDPGLMRWEVHRCYKIQAKLAPGKRHTMPNRIFYVDEDTWSCVMTDGWDAHNNYWRFTHLNPAFSFSSEGQAGFLYGQIVYNFQSNQYIVLGPWFNAPRPMGGDGLSYAPIARSVFNPDSMANSGGL